MTSGPYTITVPINASTHSMLAYEVTTAVVLGAGFSHCAGLPLQQEMAETLLNKEFHSPLDLMITQSIKEFLQAAFAWTEGTPIPALEDIFTLIDLSAASGHTLGRILTPKLLRATRRLLVDRILALIDQRFVESAEINEFVKRYLPSDLPVTTHFVVLNWDNVLERHLHIYDPRNLAVDYCVHGRYRPGDYAFPLRRVVVARVHGSSNWVYCDNCRTLFYDQYDPISRWVRPCVRQEDIELINDTFGRTVRAAAMGAEFPAGPFTSRFNERTTMAEILPSDHQRLQNCRLCGYPIGPHIATFSYRKSFRTHASADSWLAAEEVLSGASKWIFIGYSLPDADIELKHLLKTSQLKFAHDEKKRKGIDVVLLADQAAELKYRKFFGSDNVSVYQRGLADYLQRQTNQKENK